MNGSGIFEVLDRMGKLSQAYDAVQEAEHQLEASRAKVCGNCAHWMRSRSCPREKGVMMGGPSMKEEACIKFQLDPAVEARIEARETKLAEAQQSFERLKGGGS